MRNEQVARSELLLLVALDFGNNGGGEDLRSRLVLLTLRAARVAVILFVLLELDVHD